MSKIITISGQKGGCGKSTLTVVMASMLAYKYEKKVLVIDADTKQHSIALNRGIDIKMITPYPTGEKDANGEDVMTVESWEVYDAVTALMKKNISSFDIKEPNLNAKEITDIIESDDDKYDFILLDLPGNIENESYFSVIRFSDVIFIPFILDPYDFDSNFAFAKLLHDKFLNQEDISNISKMYYFWNKFNPNIRKNKYAKMQEILKTDLPKAEALSSNIMQTTAVSNFLCRNTLCAPIGKFEKYGNLGTTVIEMCEKVL